MPLAISIANQFYMALLCGRDGHLTAQNGCFRPLGSGAHPAGTIIQAIDSTITAIDSIFENNAALAIWSNTMDFIGNPAQGAVMRMSGGDLRLVDSEFLNNVVETTTTLSETEIIEATGDEEYVCLQIYSPNRLHPVRLQSLS